MKDSFIVAMLSVVVTCFYTNETVYAQWDTNTNGADIYNTNAGNVGIGKTILPTADKLHIATATNTYGIVISSSYDEETKFQMANDAGNAIAYLYKDGDGSTPMVKLNSNGDTYFNGGNIGIGKTILPAADKLHIATATNTYGIVISSSHDEETKFQMANDAGNAIAYLYKDGDGSTPMVKLNSNGDTYFNGGNIGIGKTILPAADKLHIATATNTYGIVISSSYDEETKFQMANDAGNAIAYLYKDGDGSTPMVKLNSNGDTYFNGGNIGVGTANPQHPLHMGSGAYVTAAGVWTNASSRDFKENIRDLTTDEAMETLVHLKPTIFNYKIDKDDEYIGFIAEDVPELVATQDRKGLSPMDIIAVLTKVVQEQQETISKLQKVVNKIQGKI